MADNTSVGTVSISLDLDVSSSLEKQVDAAAKKISDKLGDSLSKGDTGKELTEDLVKSISTAIDNVGEKMSKKFDQLIKEATKAGKKMGKGLSDGLSDVPVEPQVKTVDAKSSTIKPRAPSIEAVMIKQDLIDKRSLQENIQETLDHQIRIIQSKLKSLEQLPISLQTDKVQNEMVNLEMKINKLVGQSQALTIDIRSLDTAINEFDTKKAAAEQEKLSKEMDKASASANKQTLAQDRLQRSQSSTAAATERLQRSQINTAKATEQLRQSQMRTQKMMDGLNGSTKKASGGLVNMQSFGRSLVRQMLGLNMILRLVGQGVRKMAQAFWSSLKANDEFSGSLQQIKSNLSTAFQPIYQAILPAINAMMRAISTATAYLAAFISMLFGKSVKASNASAKSLSKAKKGMDGYAASAKEAQQITAGFDQLNDITESKDSGGGGGGTGESAIIPVNIDDNGITAIEKQLNKIKELIKNVFDSSPVKAFVNFVSTYFTQMYASIKRIMGTITTNIIEIWNAMLPDLAIGLNNMSELWTNVFNDLANYVSEWFPKITDQIISFIDNVFATFKPFFTLISGMWKDWTQILLDLWDKYGKRILDGIGEFITGALDTFNKIWTHIIDPIITPALEMLQDLWDNHLKDIIFQIGDFVGNAVARALELYNKFIKPVIDWLVINLGPAFTTVFNLIGGTVGGVMKGILTTVSEVIGSIRRIFDGLMDFLEGVFTGDWEKMWQGVSDIFGGIFDGLKALFKAPINWIISGLNGFLRSLNKVKIPDWVPLLGGKGFNIPEIPMLASGGVLKQPTLNIAGEYPGARSNPEIVTPQNTMADTFRSVLAEFIDAMASGQQVGQGTIDLVINIGGTKLLDTIIELAKEYQLQTGKQVLVNV